MGSAAPKSDAMLEANVQSQGMLTKYFESVLWTQSWCFWLFLTCVGLTDLLVSSLCVCLWNFIVYELFACEGLLSVCSVMQGLIVFLFGNFL